MAEIVWTQEAINWLEKIHKYISKDNPIAAQKVVQGIYAKIQLLKDFPKIGFKYRQEKDGEIRILLYGHYRIAYIINDDTIKILGVFHGAMKIENYLFIVK